MVGPVDVVEGGQVCAFHNVVGRSIVAVSAHDHTGVAGSAGLGHHIGADHVIVEGSVDEINACGYHGGELVGVILDVQGSGGLGSHHIHAVLGAGRGEGVEQTLGVNVGGAVDHAHLFITGLLCVGRCDSALEAVCVAGAEDVVVLGSDGVGSGGGAEEADLLFVGCVGDSGSAAGGGGADDQAHVLRDQRVKGVQALGRVALVVGLDDLDRAAKNSACRVDLFHGQINAGDNAVAVSGQGTGVGGDNADHNRIAALIAAGRCGRSRGCAFPTGGKAEYHADNQQHTEQFPFFHFANPPDVKSRRPWARPGNGQSARMS